MRVNLMKVGNRRADLMYNRNKDVLPTLEKWRKGDEVTGRKEE